MEGKPVREGNRMGQVRGASPELHRRAWEMRHNPTPAEARLWEALSGQKLGGLKFRFQHPVGQFVLDFYCASCKLAGEVDGGVHDARTEEDAARTQLLQIHQYRVIRFRNEEVLTNLEAVLSQILTAAPPPPPILGEPEVRSKPVFS